MSSLSVVVPCITREEVFSWFALVSGFSYLVCWCRSNEATWPRMIAASGGLVIGLCWSYFNTLIWWGTCGAVEANRSGAELLGRVWETSRSIACRLSCRVSST